MILEAVLGSGEGGQSVSTSGWLDDVRIIREDEKGTMAKCMVPGCGNVPQHIDRTEFADERRQVELFGRQITAGPVAVYWLACGHGISYGGTWVTS